MGVQLRLVKSELECDRLQLIGVRFRPKSTRKASWVAQEVVRVANSLV